MRRMPVLRSHCDPQRGKSTFFSSILVPYRNSSAVNPPPNHGPLKKSPTRGPRRPGRKGPFKLLATPLFGLKLGLNQGTGSE